MGHVMIHNTRGKDDVERASLAFLVGNVALTSGQEATLLGDRGAVQRADAHVRWTRGSR